MHRLLIAKDIAEIVSPKNLPDADRRLKDLALLIDLSYTKNQFRKNAHELVQALCSYRFGEAQRIYEDMTDKVLLVQAQKKVCAEVKTPTGLKMPIAPWSDDGSPRFARELQKLQQTLYPAISAIALNALTLRSLFYNPSSSLLENTDTIAQTTLLSAAGVLALKPNLDVLPALGRQSVAVGLVGIAAGTIFGAPLLCGVGAIAAAKMYNVYKAYSSLS